jgi:hypothetical protein
MTADEIRIIEKVLDNQKDLISAISGVHTGDQMEALRAIAETQYNITESLMPGVVTVDGAAEDGPMTLQ